MPTLRDVAELAGVSVKTASVALRDLPGVSKITASKVRHAAEELGYSVNHRRTGHRYPVIGVSIPDIEMAHYTDLTHNIIYYACAKGFAIVSEVTNDNPAGERRAMDVFKRLQVVGVITTSSRIGEDTVRGLEDEGILVVSIVSLHPGLNGVLPRFSAAPVAIDHFTSSFEATKYLTSLGHERIAYLAGPRHSSRSIAMQQGYSEALREAKSPPVQRLILQINSQTFGYQVGYNGAWELMQLPKESRPTALLCYNDELAIGAMSSITEQGMRIPEDISVIGNDDIKAARFWNPSLTTIRIPDPVLAEAAVNIVDAYVNQPANIPQYAPIVPSLVVRRSAAPPGVET